MALEQPGNASTTLCTGLAIVGHLYFQFGLVCYSTSSELDSSFTRYRFPKTKDRRRLFRPSYVDGVQVEW